MQQIHQQEHPQQQQQQQQWWDGITQARARIDALTQILDPAALPSLPNLQTSETPARDLLHDASIADAIISALSRPTSGRPDDPLCRWLYDTFHSSDPELQTLVLRFVPPLCNSYLPRASTRPGQPLAGFEALLLALYSSEFKSRQGKPLLVNIPNLSHPSLYHTPRVPSSSPSPVTSTGQLSPPLEPQEAVKTSKRAAIIGVALELYHRRIADMPVKSKLELCTSVRTWAMRGCSWAEKVDEVAKLALLQAIAPGPDPTLTGHVSTVGPSCSTSIFVPRSGRCTDDGDEQHEPETLRIPLPWELLQPVLKILGHCLMGPGSDPEVKEAAAAAARALYARATHELIAEAILPTRALLRLDEASRAAAVASAAAAAAAAGTSTPSKPKKPEILLTPGK